MAAPSWWNQVAQQFANQGVPVNYWLGVAIAENGRFNPGAINSTNEYSVGPWQYNLQGGLGSVWQNLLEWTRQQAINIFSNPVAAAPYVARDMGRAYQQSGGDPVKFMQYSGHPGANAAASNPLIQRFTGLYQNIPNNAEEAWQYAESQGWVNANTWSGGGSGGVPWDSGGSGFTGPGGADTNVHPPTNNSILGGFAASMRQALEAAFETMRLTILGGFGEWWQEHWPALLLGLIAFILITLAFLGWAWKAINTQEVKTATKLAAQVA